METVKLRDVLRRCVRAHALSEPVMSVEEATVRAAGIYGATPTCYLSMAARVRDFEIGMLDQALYERRSLVRIGAMRGFGYVLTRELVPHGLALAGASSAAQWLLPAVQRAGMTEASVGTLIASIEALLRQGAKTAAEIRKGLAGWKEHRPGTLDFVLRHMGYQGRIARTRVRGGWKSQLYEYALFRDWIHVPPRMPTVGQALQKFTPLYFEANGPATLKNFAWWAGVKEATARAAIEKAGLEPVLVDKLKGIHFATKASLDELGDAPDGGSLSLLPYWDTYMMAQTERRRYLDPKWEDRVVDAGGNVTNVVLMDGRVAGIWDCRHGTLKFAPFEPLRHEAVREAAARFAGLLEAKEVVETRPPGPLAERGQNAFQSPLG